MLMRSGLRQKRVGEKPPVPREVERGEHGSLPTVTLPQKPHSRTLALKNVRVVLGSAMDLIGGDG